MFGKKKLKGGADDVRTTDASDTQERQRATLLRNELIAGSEEIATRVMDNSRTATFAKGHRIIEQGAAEDSVYFIVSGSAEVLINKRHIDIRGAPHTVGEMAAKKAGETRTADVIVHSQSLEALVLTGTEFRKLMQDFPTFSRNLDDSIDRLSRIKIAQLGEKTQVKGPAWSFISMCVGGISCILSGIIMWLMGLRTLDIAVGSFPLGLVVFVGMLLLNPELRYRTIASAAGSALILLVAYGSISFALTIDGNGTSLPLVDFSVGTDQKLGTFSVGSIALLVLVYISGLLDLKLSKAQS